MQCIGLGSHVSDSMFHNVTDRDDSDKSAVLDHWQMAKLPLCHPLHDLLDRIGLGARLNVARHDLSDQLVAKLTTAYCARVVGKYAQNIPLR